MSTAPDTEAAQDAPQSSNSIMIAIIGIVALLAIGAIIFFVFVVGAVGGAREVEATMIKAKGMGNAVSVHQRTFMRLPFNTVDDNGKLLVSWRHQLLCFMGQQQITDYVNASAAWDDPSNAEGVGKQAPDLISPRGKNRDGAISHFVCVTDESSPMSGVKVTLDDVEARDGKTNTALFLEFIDSDIKWAEPRDLTLAQAIQAIQSNPNGKTVVVLADGRVIFVPTTATKEDLEKLFLMDNGAPTAEWMKR